MKIAIVHDWIVSIGGAEKTLQVIFSLFPKADLYTLFAKLQSINYLNLAAKKVYTSFLQKIPGITKIYRYLFPLYPFAIEEFDLSNYDLIISSSHTVAKGVLTHSNQLHICYCYTPIRYAWDMQFDYLKNTNLYKGFKSFVVRYYLHKLRQWDYITANRPDYYIAISNYIAKRIKKIYGKESIVIYPPVDIDRFKVNSNKENFYVTVSRLVPYKRVDLIIEAFSKMPDKKLIIIGNGPEFKKLQQKATKNIELLGYQPVEVVKYYLEKAKAFVFAAEEDFGISPVEAQACGTPVIAYGKGGVLETVINNVSGIFFQKQSVEDIVNAIKRFEKIEDKFDAYKIRKNAENFSRDKFEKKFKETIENLLNINKNKFL